MVTPPALVILSALGPVPTTLADFDSLWDRRHQIERKWMLLEVEESEDPELLETHHHPGN